MTTSIFLPEVVDFMLPIDFYSRFDPITTLCQCSDDNDEDGGGSARENGITSDGGDIFGQSYLYGGGYFG